MNFLVRHAPARFSMRCRRLAVTAAIAFMVVGIGEIVARFGLGLGDPPLNVAFPGVEYMFRPGVYRRFGNTIRINSHHMRSDEFPARRSQPDEIRVLLMGDSVVNGGSLTDQADLASEQLRRDIATRTGRPVIVGNVSAGSWGPGNLLAYVQRFGLFDADLVVVVLNSGDAGDNPTNQPVVGVDPSFPDRSPWSALGEAVDRYVIPRLVPRHATTTAPGVAEATGDATARSMQDLATLCGMVESSGARVILAHFPRSDELDGHMLAGHDAIAALAAARGITMLELAPPLAAVVAAGSNPYRSGDVIHPNAMGQQIVAAALLPEILRRLDTATTDHEAHGTRP